MGRDGDVSSKLRIAQQENKQLRAQLEHQYKLMIQMTETIQNTHLVRIQQAADAAASNSSMTHAYKTELEQNASTLDTNASSTLTTGLSAADQAEQLRTLEEQARKWAKKFLHKVKQAASQAEQQAGVSAGAVSQDSMGSTHRTNGSAQVHMTPSKSESSIASAPHSSHYSANGVAYKAAAEAQLRQEPLEPSTVHRSRSTTAHEHPGGGGRRSSSLQPGPHGPSAEDGHGGRPVRGSARQLSWRTDEELTTRSDMQTQRYPTRKNRNFFSRIFAAKK